MHDAPSSSSSRRALLALLLTVPAPSVGVIAGMMLWQGRPIGQAAFIACKVWMAVLPFVWWKWVDRKPLSWSPPRKGGFGMGAATGVAIAGVIFAGYLLLMDWVVPPADAARLRDAMIANGLGNPLIYIAGCVYWITINSLLEEYVYRWFLVIKSEQTLARLPLRGRTRAWLAVLMSAAFFTIHHVIAMAALGLSWPCVVLSNIGVFIGGAIWSWMYERYQSIWPSYLSHAIVDVPIFVIGWMLMQAGA
jgi:hypothetical protein